jgi:hypothetical protein
MNFQIKTLSKNDKKKEQFKQFDKKLLEIFPTADSLVDKKSSFLLRVPSFDWSL